MPIRRVHAHEKVREDQGKVALMRGPLVYCLEAADQPGTDLFGLSLPRDAALYALFRGELLGGMTVLKGTALAGGQPTPITAIPAYAWGNRDKGAMTIWVGEPGGKEQP